MKTFLPGAIASAADVNANFAELKDGLDDALADTGWQPHGGTTHADFTYRAVQWRIRDGICYWRGQIWHKSNAWPASETAVITSLPAQVRPIEDMPLTVYSDVGAYAALIDHTGRLVMYHIDSAAGWPFLGGCYPLG